MSVFRFGILGYPQSISGNVPGNNQNKKLKRISVQVFLFNSNHIYFKLNNIIILVKFTLLFILIE